jgi:hypothetical protein
VNEPNRSVITIADWLRRCLMSDDTPEQLPTLAGKVDGVVSLDPPMIQCRGCGVIHTGEPGKLWLLTQTCNILFHVADGRTRRLCADCRAGCSCPTCRDRRRGGTQ